MTPKQQIRQHAENSLAQFGTIFVKNVRKKPGFHAATVILATIDTVEYYKAYVADGAVGMVKIKTTLILLPLFC